MVSKTFTLVTEELNAPPEGVDFVELSSKEFKNNGKEVLEQRAFLH
jgi:hypothetical protein